MKLFSAMASLCLIATLPIAAIAQTPANYTQGPDSKPQPGVPKGEVLHFTFEQSKVFPGTFRDYWVYVPAQYRPDQPACLYVNQDGIQWDAPTVFDNLIAKKEMPVTIGVFVMHGRVRAADGKSALDRFNRSYEYDGLGDNYARSLIEELLLDVEKKMTSDGRAIHFSHSGNDHAIGGSSSGAIAAFTAAWERPDAFSRVFSAIGTYVGLRGGERYPTLIRKYEPKPLRIFLQDGSNDLNIYGGDWWMANQSMERALTFAGYSVDHAWGDLGHDGRQGAALFPDVMRWLWKDWPQPITPGQTGNAMINAILISGEGWQPVGSGYRSTTGIAANAKGEAFFVDSATDKSYRIGVDGMVTPLATSDRKVTSQAFGTDGKRYLVGADRGTVTAYDAAGKTTVLTKGIRGSDLVVGNNGTAYIAEMGESGGSRLWTVRPNGKKQVLTTDLKGAGGVTLSPDQTLLYVSEGGSHWVASYQIQPDGSLAYGQRYYWLHSPDSDDDSGAGGMAVDGDGRLYVATRLGIQVCDQAGRVNAILPLPGGKATSLCFGGEKFDTLYVTCGDKVYRRKLKVTGSNAWAAPHRPAPPGL